MSHRVTAWTPIVDRDRVVVTVGLLALTTLAWGYLVTLAPHAAGGVAMPDTSGWGVSQFLTAASMWMVMMVAMMLPTVAPWVAALSTVSASESREVRARLASQFIAGYLAIWCGYSVAAAAAQWALHEAGLMSGSASASLGVRPSALLLIGAGVFQWTPVRRACLKHCQSPLGFFLTSWRSGAWGPWRMGARHGLFCVACCWALMALSFVAGVMNLAWMALVTVFVLIDHALVRGEWLGRAVGLGLIAWGGRLLL